MATRSRPAFAGSIRNRLLLMMLSVVTVAALTGYSSFVYWSMSKQQERLTEFSKSIAAVLSQEFARIVMLNDLAVAADASARLSTFPVVRHAVLYDRSGKPLYQYRKDTLEAVSAPELPTNSAREPVIDRDEMHLFLPASYSGSDFGTVYLQLEAESVWALLERDALMLLVIGVLAMLLSLALALRFEASFNRPILRLVAFLERIGLAPHLDQRIESDESNEFGRLYREVNTMLERIQSSREALRIAAVAFETPDGMMITDANGRILQVNDAFTAITGYTAAEVIGQTPSVLQSGRHGPDFFNRMWSAVAESDRWEGEIWNRHRDGRVFPERLTIQSVRDETGEVRYYVGAFTDLTQQKAAESRVKYLTLYDPLTGLPNRRLLSTRLTDSLRHAERTGQYCALLCFDLDNFKMINDTLGHELGDQVLIQLAARLRVQVGERCLLARLVADEFVALYEGLGQDAGQAAFQAEVLAEQALAALDAPYQLDGQDIRCAPCVGITLYPAADTDAQELIKQADLALHQAKGREDGKRLRFFDPESQRLVRRYLDFDTQLQRALEQQELVLHYQIQVDVNRKVIGAESLIRWQHPDLGMVSPAEFIPVAERSGQIIPIGNWVLRTACRQLAVWQTQPATRDWVMALNVSASQFRQPDFIDYVRQALEGERAPAHMLKLELTEGVLIEDIDATVSKMSALRQLGVGISLDDFGTGYSSLRYLKRLPVTQVKIDQSFVRNMISDANDTAIIRIILSLGETFGMDVIAEGVETEADYRFLVDLGCRSFQGYFFGRPQSADQIMQMLPTQPPPNKLLQGN